MFRITICFEAKWEQSGLDMLKEPFCCRRKRLQTPHPPLPPRRLESHIFALLADGGGGGDFLQQEKEKTCGRLYGIFVPWLC
jgi:hypothetical protein